MNPDLRNKFFIGGAVLLAMIGAVQIAGGSVMLTALLCGAVLALILNRVQPVPLGALVVGLVMAGYIIGNRGFAQLSFAGSAPLLPAEIALVAGCGALLFNSIAQHELPLKHDLLNCAILLWMVIGSVRLLFDIRQFGFLAVRDYAMVYYSAFFFIAQNLARNEISRHFLLRSLTGGSIILLIVQPFYLAFPDFFLRVLTIRGIPVIYYKGDLLATFMAMLSLLCFLRYEATKKTLLLFLSLIAMGFLHTSNNRASFAGLLVATILLIAGRRWRFAVFQLGIGLLAALLIVLVAFGKGKSWESTPVYEFYERTISMVDPFSKHAYTGEDTSYKGDNNAFRLVWWELVITKTIDENPWTGLGFGYDLASDFVKKYFPTQDDDFTVRSPHNILVTVFARMGLVGLMSFLAIVGLLFRGALLAVRRPASDIITPSLWCSACIIFTAACFGVVLEGPMGAIVFWTLLGLGHHELTAFNQQENQETPVDTSQPASAKS